MKSEWKRIYISSNFVKARTQKAVLIAMPRSSEYAGFAFWHPAKLVRNGYVNDVSISYTKDFVIRLKKYDTGKYNSHEVTETKEIPVRELVRVYNNLKKGDTLPDEPEIHVPEPLEPEGTEADESLIDDD